ncbi:MAG: tyrosine--tRNA ligase [Planctomycetota bacterium]|nr:tyrosine--tRNA ligase [Planctomycetota bacterium]
MTTTPIDFLEELRWRGLLHQCTDEQGLAAHLADPGANPRRAYAGFDPTADSLTIGNLVPIMALVHFARAGHKPLVVMGGGTGMIGDPSGKSAERTLMTTETIAANVARQRGIFEAVFAGAGLPEPEIANNADWLCKLSYLDALRDIGKHFSVNMMIQKESVKERLHNREQGISYTEFSYMILQAYDFAHLFRKQGVTVQLGGSDQWGNIVAGSDLIRRQHATQRDPRASTGSASTADNTPPIPHTPHTFGLTNPLVTKSDGGKFGKTETGAVWLTRERTSPYAIYQFWLNTTDEDIIKFLKLFTLLTKDEIEALEAAHAERPGAREAHRALAHHATALLHGEAEAVNAANAAKALFSGQIADLPKDLLAEVFAEIPSSDHPRTALEGNGVCLTEFLIEVGLAKSKREAREFLANSSVSINGHRATPEHTLTPTDLLHDEIIALRRGKKAWHLTRWS